MSKKRGKLHTDELNFIRRNVIEMTDDEIAAQLNRSIEIISKIVTKENLRPNQDPEDQITRNRLKQTLYKRQFWPIVQRQFFPDELKYFEDEWIRIQLQFKEDILPTEELQIKQFLTTLILMNRAVIGQRSNLEIIDQLQKQLDEEYKKSVDDRDINLITSLTTQIGSAKASTGMYTVEYTKLTDDRNRLQKELRASRADRIKRVEDSKTSWQGVLLLLENEDKRAEYGEEAELFKIAAQTSAQKLAEWHEYEDGKVDQPLLDVEYLKDDKYEQTNSGQDRDTDGSL